MENEQPKKKYPILAVRMSEKELSFLREEAKNKGLKLSKYIRAILIPFDLPSGN